MYGFMALWLYDNRIPPPVFLTSLLSNLDPVSPCLYVLMGTTCFDNNSLQCNRSISVRQHYSKRNTMFSSTFCFSGLFVIESCDLLLEYTG